MITSGDPLISLINSMSEKEIQSRLIEPLLSAMEFFDVRDCSGRSEKGRDLFARKMSEFDDDVRVGIQIKKIKLSGTVSSSKSFKSLIEQLKQAIEEPLTYPLTGEQLTIDRLIFITTYQIKEAVADNFKSSLGSLKHFNVAIIDGVKLCRLLRTHIPQSLAEISGEETYRLSLDRRANELKDAQRAFQLEKKLELERIYVEADLRGINESVAKIASLNINKKSKNICEYLMLQSDLKCFQNLGWDKFIEVASLPKQKAKLDKLNLISPDKSRLQSTKNIIYARFDAVDFLVFLQNLCPTYEELLTLSNKDTAPQGVEGSFRRLTESGIRISDILKVPCVKHALENNTRNTKKVPSIWAGHTIHSTNPILILGPAGMGKSTLLKRLTQILSRKNTSSVPIFIPLVRLKNCSADAIIEYCIDDLLAGGFSFESSKDLEKQFLEMLVNDKFSLFFDGVDEKGEDAFNMLIAIQALVRNYKIKHILISCRNSLKIEWQGSIFLELQTFSPEQVHEFIDKWFDSEPTARREIKVWLSKNRNIQEIAKTPIIAALICSLFDSNVDLPDNENDLYERRLELLLGGWDSAKSRDITPLPIKVRKIYFHFLMKLAYFLHSQNRREIELSKAIAFSQKYRISNLHRLKDSLILDCVGRNLLELNQFGEVSFGHLTFQEHLTARYLAHHNPIAEMYGYICDPFWDKVLEFYAARLMDISLLAQAVKDSNEEESGEKFVRLRALLKYAPLTNKKIISLYRQV